MNSSKSCLFCLIEFVCRTGNQKFCSVSCRKKQLRVDRKLCGICVDCSSAVKLNSIRCTNCNLRMREWNKNRDLADRRPVDKKIRFRLKQDVISGYGGKCVCCNESNLYFLSIDHINNNGSKHRKEFGRTTKLYYWLKKNNYPREDYQLLCFNCNLSKGFFGYCHTVPEVILGQNLPYYTRRRYKIKKEVLIVYGNKCACCEESKENFLCIDHIDGDGNTHRKELGGFNIYQWLRANNYPKDKYQLLCWNCNEVKAQLNICPHQLNT